MSVKEAPTAAPAPASTEGRGDMVEAFRNLMRHTTVGSTAEAQSPIRALVEDWLGVDPLTLPGFSDAYYGLMQVNVQAALDAFLAAPGRESKIVGVHAPSAAFWEQVPFSRLLSAPSFKWGGASVGLVDYQMRPYGPGEYMPCLERGLVFFRDAEGAGAIWLTHHDYFNSPVSIEILTTPGDRAPKVIDELRALSEELSPYKGKMFRIRLERSGPVPEFMQRQDGMTADDLILPDGVLDQIEQHTVAVARKRKKLKKLGMHLKRGILLHGPPGTGKTHTIRYLASQMRDSTVVILPKQAIGMAHELVKILEPAVIVLDDIDLVAENRSLPGMTGKNLLFEVLETLDGMQDTDDILFVLTTNRADTMEPAIAARPGRVDQTVEIPRPDDVARRRLFELYCQGVDLRASDADIDKVLERTQGVTASFFKELLRRATVKAVKAGAQPAADGRVPVTADVLFEALDRMLDPNNPMTRLLLGAEPDHAVAGVILQEI